MVDNENIEEAPYLKKKKTMFCDDCGSLRVPVEKDGKRTLYCRDCDTYDTIDNLENQSIVEKSSKEKGVLELEEDYGPEIPGYKCPKCGGNQGYRFLQKFGAADEPEHQITKCGKCGYTDKEGWQI